MKWYFLLLTLALPTFSAFAAPSKIAFWNQTRRGANFFNEEETPERFREARKIGIEVVRLVFNKWKSLRPGAKYGDFLIGPKDSEFTGLVAEDLAYLKKVLGYAHAAGIKVVITNLSLPGLRWVQHNKNQNDFRLWGDFRFHAETESFWKELALALKDEPAVVGYNLLNEPHPEKVKPGFQDWYLGNYERWYESVRNTPRDLNLFHERLAAAVRQVDPETPIVLDSGFYATPFAFKVLRPLADEKTIYSVHMYEPYSFTNYHNEGKFSYPGQGPIGESEPPAEFTWNRSQLEKLLEPVVAWQKKFGVPASRIFVSEFGTFRANRGAADYLEDLLSIFEARGWHWAFYSYREDTWAGMDYELGETKHEPGEVYPLVTRKKHYRGNRLFDAIRRRLTPR